MYFYLFLPPSLTPTSHIYNIYIFIYIPPIHLPHALSLYIYILISLPPVSRCTHLHIYLYHSLSLNFISVSPTSNLLINLFFPLLYLSLYLSSTHTLTDLPLPQVFFISTTLSFFISLPPSISPHPISLSLPPYSISLNSLTYHL